MNRKVEFPIRSAWSDNIPFAFWLVETIKPKLFVELGVHTGVSYFAICQVVKELNLETKCFAIDTWKGDQHTGFYGEGVYANFIQYERKYSDFSTSTRSTFDAALNQFEDHSIDLLHIDGFHTYEAVKHDFESWLPKLTDDAVVLFHDIVCERFEVNKYWEELSQKYPHFILPHGCGLGVLSLNGRLAAPSSLKHLIAQGEKLMTYEFWEWFNSYAYPKLGHRSTTFKKIFEHLDNFNDPVIIETGCIRATDVGSDAAWNGDGCSTILFDKYVSLNGGCFWSIDIEPERVKNAEKLVGENSQVCCGDSVEFLNNFAKSDQFPSPHLVYLDSWEFERHIATESQVHHFNELRAILPKLTPITLVVVDDSPVEADEDEGYIMGGKGAIISKYASELGIPLVFSEYQAGWLGFPGFRSLSDGTNHQLIEKARALTKEGNWARAYPLYKSLFIRLKMFKRIFSKVKSDKLDKMYAEVCAYFARMASTSKRYGTAHDWYVRALAADPSAHDYRLEMVTRAMKPLGWLSVARLETIRVTEEDPDSPIAWLVLGEIEAALDNIPASKDAYSKFVDKSNNSTYSLLTKATFLIKANQHEDAETLCDVIISRGESLGDALICKGVILANYGDHEGAIETFNKALEHQCLNDNDSMAMYYLSLSLFSIGRHKEGWQTLFTARMKNTSFPPLYGSLRRFTQPLKQLFVMQPPPAVVHIHAEAGEGDNLLFMRYLPLLVAKGYTVRYEARDSVLKLAQDSFPNVEVIPLAKDFPGTSGIPYFDYHLPVVDLPFIFQTDIDTIPWTGPYIKADPKLVETYKDYKGKIGISWSTGLPQYRAGNIDRSYARNKSLDFDWLKPIIDIDPSMFVSLQAGSARVQNDRIDNPLSGKDFIWAETAALIENLDLVITVDTAVAHLAGAMGKPTYLMMHKHLTSFQFLGEYKDAFWNTASPWYPSMRIFRQKTRGDWDSVVAKIADELKSR